MEEKKLIMALFEQLKKAELNYFPEKGKVDITCNKGVYIIFSPDGKVMHVGNTPRGKNGLRQRLNNHIYKKSSFSKKFLGPKGLSVRDEFSFRVLEVPCARHRMLLEALAIGELCPEHLGTYESVKDDG